MLTRSILLALHWIEPRDFFSKHFSKVIWGENEGGRKQQISRQKRYKPMRKKIQYILARLEALGAGLLNKLAEGIRSSTLCRRKRTTWISS